MKRYFGIIIVVLTVSATIVFANDLAIYSGPTNPGWISNDAVKENTETVMNDAGVKSLFNKIETSVMVMKKVITLRWRNGV